MVEMYECGCCMKEECDGIAINTDRWVMRYFLPFKVIFSHYIFDHYNGLENVLRALKMTEEDFLYYLSTNGWGPVPEKYKEYIDSLTDDDYNDMFVTKLKKLR